MHLNACTSQVTASHTTPSHKRFTPPPPRSLIQGIRLAKACLIFKKFFDSILSESPYSQLFIKLTWKIRTFEMTFKASWRLVQKKLQRTYFPSNYSLRTFLPLLPHFLSSCQIFLPLISAPTGFHDWGLITRWAELLITSN